MADLALTPDRIEPLEKEEIDISYLITEDDEPVDNIFSEKQMRLLTEPLYSSWEQPREFVAMANVGFFYSSKVQAVVPDVLVSMDVLMPQDMSQKKNRSYFIWEFGKPPDLVVEIVSNREGEELGHKKEIYERTGVAYYVVFDPFYQLGKRDLYLFQRNGGYYKTMSRPWFPMLSLGLQLWDGVYENMEATWLRWHDADQRLILTGAENSELEKKRAEQERQRAEQERQRAEQESQRAEQESQRAEQESQRAEQKSQRAERLAARLRDLGLENEDLE